MKHYKSISLALILISCAALAGVAAAQSTDQSNPTPITSNELVIAGPKKTNQQYYYSFTAGPGEVTLSLSVRAKASSTFVGIKVFDAELNTVTYHNMSADTSPSMALKKFDVGEKQTLVLSFNSDPSLAECKIKFGGAVDFGATETSSASASNGGGLPATATDAMPKATVQSNDQPAMTDGSGSSGGSSGSTGSAGKNKTFLFDILDAAGKRFNLPTTGNLRIEMKDGSIQEVDLTQVKKISVKN